MKKTTKLLTAFATAVALVLGAGAFVSCSNSSDDSSSAPSTAEQIAAAKKAIDGLVDAFEAKDYQKITEDNVKKALKDDAENKDSYTLSDKAEAFNTQLLIVQGYVDALKADGDENEPAATAEGDGNDANKEGETTEPGDKNDGDEEPSDAEILEHLKGMLDTVKDESNKLEDAFDALSDAERVAAVKADKKTENE